MAAALAPRKTRYRVLRKVTDRIDEAMTAGDGRPWENRSLGQAEDVRPWIDNPEAIDYRLGGNLTVLDELLGRFKAPRLLDVGCYGGYLAGWVAQRHPRARYVGVDVDKAAVAAARSAHPGSPAKFVVADLFNLKPVLDAEGPFDVAACFRVVIHTPWLTRALAALHAAAPVAAVGLRLATVDAAEERVDDVSGLRHWFRVYSEETVRAAAPPGALVAIHRSAGYDTLVIG